MRRLLIWFLICGCIAAKPRQTPLVSSLRRDGLQFLEQPLIGCVCFHDHGPVFVVTDMHEIVLSGGYEKGVPAKYEAGNQEGVQLDEFITSEPMSGSGNNWASLSEA